MTWQRNERVNECIYTSQLLATAVHVRSAPSFARLITSYVYVIRSIITCSGNIHFYLYSIKKKMMTLYAR